MNMSVPTTAIGYSPPMVRRPVWLFARAGLVGAFGLCAVVVAGMRFVPSHIGAHLRADIQGNALVDLPQVHVRVDGRDAIVTGTVASSEERAAVIAQVATRWGVRTVRASGLRVVPDQTTARVDRSRDAGGTTGPGSKTVSSKAVTVAIPIAASAPAVNTSTIAPSNTTTIATSAGSVTVTPDILAAFDRDVAALLTGRPIQFVKGSIALPAANDFVVAAIATRLSQMPPGVHFEVRAHTDASGPVAANIQLSQARADVFVRALVARGVPQSAMTALGVGPAEPVGSNATPAGRILNRRIEVRVQRTEA